MRAGIFLLCLLLPHALLAEPMTVDADKFVLVQDKQQVDFFGHVVIKRDDMILRADKVRVWYQEDKATGKKVLKQAEAIGHVDIDTEDSKGKSDYALFTANSNILVMKGDAFMVSKQGKVEGEHITYNTVTKDTKVVGGESGKQVRFTFDEAQ
ncbi:MAG TPA: lipopolysaccharide transport periplasmic protein LptA [Mariprofundaceae bacterium]|nr:lipopolysaccharide transport periplasmic protein LptA [Mariprofundaceae bacterium]